jgi:hypothetical protein
MAAPHAPSNADLSDPIARLATRPRHLRAHFPIVAIALIGLLWSALASFFIWRWEQSLAEESLADAAQGQAAQRRAHDGAAAPESDAAPAAAARARRGVICAAIGWLVASLSTSCRHKAGGARSRRQLLNNR